MTLDPKEEQRLLEEAKSRKQKPKKALSPGTIPSTGFQTAESVPGIEEKALLASEQQRTKSLNIPRPPSEKLVIDQGDGPDLIQGPPDVGDIAGRLVKELKIGNQFKGDIQRIVDIGGVGLISTQKGLFENLADSITGKAAKEKPSRDAVAAVLKRRLTKDAYLRFLSLPGFEEQFRDEIFSGPVSDRDVATFITLKANRSRRFNEQAIRIGAQEFLIVGPAVASLKRTFQALTGKTNRTKFTETFKKILKEETGAIDFTPSPTRTRPDVKPFDPNTYDPFSPDRAPDEITRTIRRIRRTFEPDIPGTPEPSVKPRTTPDVIPLKSPERTIPIRRTESDQDRRSRRSVEKKKEAIRKERAAKELAALSEALSVPEKELVNQLGVKAAEVTAAKPKPSTQPKPKTEGKKATASKTESDPAAVTDAPTRPPTGRPGTPPGTPPRDVPTVPPPGTPPGKLLGPERFELPDGSKLREGQFPKVVEFPLGVSIVRINLQTGRRTFRSNPNPTADPAKGFKIVSFMDKPPKKRTLEQGIVDIRVKPSGIDFRARKPSKKRNSGMGRINRRMGL